MKLILSIALLALAPSGRAHAFAADAAGRLYPGLRLQCAGGQGALRLYPIPNPGSAPGRAPYASAFSASAYQQGKQFILHAGGLHRDLGGPGLSAQFNPFFDYAVSETHSLGVLNLHYNSQTRAYRVGLGPNEGGLSYYYDCVAN